MRLAWFSPWPPQTSGIAANSAEIVPLLAASGCAIDVFVDARAVSLTSRAGNEGPAQGAVRIQSAHEFVWRTNRGQYDLTVYQVGNSRLHEYLWPYLFRWPGLAVFHDARLHHARGSAHLRRDQAEAYREEFAWNHPDTPPAAAELAVYGFAGPYYYQWPMTRAVLAASRLVACHSRGACAELSAAAPGTEVVPVALGHGLAHPISTAARVRRRQSLGLHDEHVVFGVFGALTAEKRLPQILDAFGVTRRHLPQVRLVLAGAVDQDLDVPALVASLRLEEDVSLVQAPNAEVFDELIGSVDVALCLRWPTAAETSGPWLRALSAARATVVIDLAHQTDVPALDPRSWQLLPAAHHAAPVSVAIDILDEAHSLRRAMERLAIDAPLRATLGAQGRQYWEREHSMKRMLEDYLRVIARASALPDPVVDLPAGLRPDPMAHARVLLQEFGDVPCALP